ncbi:MAG: alkaline phosphatase, partial [Lentisphaeria bacterium]|nr:alkaline phosphatase [Lentisphaeria bacterium]
MKKLLSTLFAMWVLTVSLVLTAAELKPVKYVFLFIGDGMSIPQRMMAEEYSKRIGQGKLFINSMPYQAVTTTHSANEFITDSAASGTAIACGEKTINGCIGMDKTRKRNLTSTAKVAKAAGRKVGIITSITINHATPASFYANNPSRSNYYAIALDLVNSNFDYFGGGGAAQNNDKKSKLYKGDIYDLAAQAGYKVAHGKKAIRAIQPGSGKVFAVGAKSALPYAIDRTAEDMPLADFVKHAIQHLDNEKGFFIMTEGGRIDPVCHSNDAATVMHEIIDFDNAVKAAFEFAKKHPAETLIVVTGNHDTGGLTLGFAGTGYKSYLENLQYQKCSSVKLAYDIKDLADKKGKLVFDDIKKVLADKFNMYTQADKNAVSKQLILNNKELKEIETAFNA